MNKPNPPAPGSKPSPVSPERAAAIAKAKADATEMTLDRYRALCANAGVLEVRLSIERDGIVTTLRGVHKQRHIAVDVKCPKGHPFPLYAMRALEEFRLGRGEDVPHLPPDVPKVEESPPANLDTATPEELDAIGGLLGVERGDGEDDDSYRRALRREVRFASSLGPKQPYADDTEPPPPDTEPGSLAPDNAADEGETVEEFARKVAPETTKPASLGTPPVVAAAQAAVEQARLDNAARAAEIAKRSKPVNIHKPPPAGAGTRKPLGLPLCKMCKAQPVYNAAAEFCGGECAKRWHMKAAADARGVKL